MKLEITDIQRGSTHDGPGLRTTVFFKGCPLRCLWCHNPETQKTAKEFFYRPDKCIGCLQCTRVCPAGGHRDREGVHEFDPTPCIRCMACAEACPGGALEAVSSTMTVEQVLTQVLEDKPFYRRRGGLTVSGGEPTAQKDGLLALLEGAKAAGISTCLETCGYFPESLVPALAERVDLFLYDIKDTDPARHLENTGGSLERIVHNLRLLDSLGAETVMRCVLIPEVNLNDAHADELIRLYKSLRHCKYIELLPYHPYGLSKAVQLGREDMRFTQPEPEQVLSFARRLTAAGIGVKFQGSML